MSGRKNILLARIFHVFLYIELKIITLRHLRVIYRFCVSRLALAAAALRLVRPSRSAQIVFSYLLNEHSISG